MYDFRNPTADALIASALVDPSPARLAALADCVREAGFDALAAALGGDPAQARALLDRSLQTARATNMPLTLLVVWVQLTAVDARNRPMAGHVHVGQTPWIPGGGGYPYSLTATPRNQAVSDDAAINLANLLLSHHLGGSSDTGETDPVRDTE